MFLFAGSEIITMRAENINDSKTNRLIAYGILSQKPQVSNGFSLDTGRDIRMISKEIGVITLQDDNVGASAVFPSLPSSSPGQRLWAQQVPAVPGGINAHCRSLHWAPPWLPRWCSSTALLQLQWHRHFYRNLLNTNGSHCLKWPAWHTNPFYTEYPHAHAHNTHNFTISTALTEQITQTLLFWLAWNQI